MTKDEIIRMAREVGAIKRHWGNSKEGFAFENDDQLERFAALVAAHEREACAQVAERFEPDEKCSYVEYASAAIRARGEK